MKSILIIPAIVASAFVAGCATSAALNNVRRGMTKAEVIALLGNPDSTSAQGNIESLTYYLQADSGYGRDQPYLVRLVDGKVESFGRFAQLYDMQNRPLTGGPGTVTTTQMGPLSPATTVIRTQNASSSDIASQLQQLKLLHDQGVLTDDEFTKAKAKVISGGN